MNLIFLFSNAWVNDYLFVLFRFHNRIFSGSLIRNSQVGWVPSLATNSILSLGGTCWGNTFFLRSSQQLPHLRLGPLKSFLKWHCALQGPSTRLVHSFRNYIEIRTPLHVPLVADVPGHRQEQLMQTLILIIDCKKSTEKNWVSD